MVSLDDYRELYEATKEWVDSKTAEVKSRNFPNNIKDMEVGYCGCTVVGYAS